MIIFKIKLFFSFSFSRSKTIIDLEPEKRTNPQANRESYSIEKNVRSKQVPLVSAGDWSSHVSTLYLFLFIFFSFFEFICFGFGFLAYEF